jgi:PAT family acetyl-CoA transporter-like MFS transporter 1
MNNDDENNYEKIQIKEKSFFTTIARSQRLPKKDILSICFLTFLYFLQGVPLGLTGSIPFILSSRKVSYVDQGTFSFAFWPFSLKVLWAPVVDSIFSKRIGRRKSWLVPMQYLIGFFMFLTADYVNELLEGELSEATIHSDVFMLTLIFFSFTFLAATQDIAVDGWGLTILSK